MINKIISQSEWCDWWFECGCLGGRGEHVPNNKVLHLLSSYLLGEAGGLCGVPAVREGGNSRKRGLKGMNLEAGGGKGTPLFEKGRELLNRNFIIHVSLLQA